MKEEGFSEKNPQVRLGSTEIQPMYSFIEDTSEKNKRTKKRQKPVKWIDLYNKLLLSLAGTHISYTHGKFSSCIQGTFLFSTLHSNQVDFSSMAACSDESWIWWKCYRPGIHCKDQQCFAVSTSVKCFHPLTSRLITLSCSPWT